MDVFGCKFQCALHLLIHLKIIDPHVMWHLLHFNHGQQPWSTRMDKRAFYLMQHLSHDIYAFWMRFALRLSFSIFMTFDLKVFPQHAISNLKFKTRIISNKCIHYKTLSLFLMLRSGYPWGILICRLKLCCLVVHTLWATVREWLPAVTPVHFQDRPFS